MSKESILQKAQILLNLQQEKVDQLAIIIDIQTDALLTKISETVIPPKLEYIVLETSIARYNRIGSEGLSSEAVDAISQSFTDDLFEAYLADIFEYNQFKNKPSNRLKLF